MNKKHRLKSLILGGLTLIVTVAIGAWFFNNFEQVTKEVPIGASPEARRNPLLAAERFLSRVGIEVESVAGRQLLRDLPAPGDTLVVRGLGPLTQARQERLEEWIEDGGRLIVEATELWGDTEEADDFLSRFGIYLTQEDDVDAGLTELLTEVLVDGGDQTLGLTIELVPGWHLDGGDADAARVVANGEARLIQIELGNGMLTVLSDTELFTNDGIGAHDNALFLAHLADPEPARRVWLLYDSSMPWLGTLLWAAMPQALVSFGVLLLVWLWSLSARLGPLQTPPQRSRRDLLEHMDAAGSFLWRQRLGSRLVESTRRRVLNAWEHQHPDLRHLDPENRVKGISDAAGRPQEGVADALIGQADDTKGFVRQAARLQSLWLAARPGRRGRQHRGTDGGDGSEPR